MDGLLPDVTPLRPGLFRSCGPALTADCRALGIACVGDLRRAEPDALYAALCRLRGPQDICVLDQLRCVVEQARDPACPAERRDWSWWSRQRKADAVPPLSPVPEAVHER